ncbi:MAG: DsbC family protein [Rhodocyclaceae bacterium]
MFDKMLKPALLAAALSVALGAQASEESVKASMEQFIGSPSVESVRKTEYGGLYEVVLKSGELVYTDETLGFIIDGRVIDTKTRKDVTQARLQELSAIDFATLPLDRAIKQVKGDGSRVVVSFEDPNCGYCKRLGKELSTLDNVTVYTFLYPILSEDSVTKSRNIWCAKDQAKAWNDWILKGVTPPAAQCDSDVVDQNVAYGQGLRIQGTPTLFLADGRRIGGYVPAAELDKALNEAGSR